MNSENSISKAKNILLVLPSDMVPPQELLELCENFCGTVVDNLYDIQEVSGKRIYVCGDINKLNVTHIPMRVIKELSQHYHDLDNGNIQLVSLGQVPIIVHQAGVFFKALFEDEDYFEKIKAEHDFQDLTESTKPGKSLRKGIYITEVTKELSPENHEMLHYRLLRCSSNFSGPTDNFRETDHKIVQVMNEAASYVFEERTSLNHVLAQIYENKKNDDAKESKAKIPAHSDKTKDMPKNALIAFCTFYDKANFKYLKPSKYDRYDWCYGDTSGLTKLHFKLKNSVHDPNLAKEFSVVLYPNSVFFIPLSTNRLYTHEIKPSVLNIDKMPTRMGYVVRCSNAEAVFMDQQTYLKENDTLVKLVPMTLETMTDLKNLYYEENITENTVAYNKVHFSMNAGDYQRPNY